MDENNQSDKTIENQSEEPEPSTPVDNAKTSETSKESTSTKIRTILLLAIIGLIILGAAVIAWQVTRSEPVDEGQVDDTMQVIEPADISELAVNFVDGQVSHYPAGAGWQSLTLDSQLKQGDRVRTGADANLALRLDDGSVVRLDSNTELELVSLAESDIRFNQHHGSVYSRIITSNRQYTIDIEGTSYQALGTAFVTVSVPGNSGVQVFHNAVRSSGSEKLIDEGQQYYQDNVDPALENKISDVNMENLADNEFIRWNLNEDEKDDRFKNKLGILAQVKQIVKQRGEAEAALERAAAAAEAARQKAAQQAAEEAAEREQRQQKKPESSYQKRLVKRGEMNLWQRGGSLGWGYTGKAIYGYKIVYSYRDTNPKFGEPKTEAVYVSNQYASSYPGFRGKLNLMPNKTYYVTICAYTDGSESDRCVDYSRVLRIKT